MSKSLHLTERPETLALASTAVMAEAVITLAVFGYFATFLLMQLLPL